MFQEECDIENLEFVVDFRSYTNFGSVVAEVVVTSSWPKCHEFELLKTCCVEGLMHVSSVQTDVLPLMGCGSYTRAFGDGPHNFEPWSSDVDDT
ncbi:hypothetical protein TNCV_1666871 [Trichonephila clavipes]|nr:hypothetical protein TNCV_1666871 [Trichonephila clavipes]